MSATSKPARKRSLPLKAAEAVPRVAVTRDPERTSAAILAASAKEFAEKGNDVYLAP